MSYQRAPVKKKKQHTTPLRTMSVSESLLWYTTPGQSIRKILLVKVIYCQTFVSPGIGATLQTFKYINKVKLESSKDEET